MISEKEAEKIIVEALKEKDLSTNELRKFTHIHYYILLPLLNKIKNKEKIVIRSTEIRKIIHWGLPVEK